MWTLHSPLTSGYNKNLDLHLAYDLDLLYLDSDLDLDFNLDFSVDLETRLWSG